VAAVQSEEIGSWVAESVTEEIEILDLQLALLAVHFAAQDGTQVLMMMNQHRIQCCFLVIQCAASFSSVP
jgi:response regulator of citrate/malate metabolism